jgi:hypothetical protein
LGFCEVLPDTPGFFFQIRLSSTRTDAAAHTTAVFTFTPPAASILNSLGVGTANFIIHSMQLASEVAGNARDSRGKMCAMYQEVAGLLRRGNNFEAIQACLKGFEDLNIADPDSFASIARVHGSQFALERARALMWIAAAFAKEEYWTMVRDTVRFSYKIYAPPRGTQAELWIKVLFMASNPETPKDECEVSRLMLESSIVSAIEEDMINGLLE